MTAPSRTPAYGRRRRKLQAYGRWQPYVDAGPARDHVNNVLRAAGMGPVAIARASGVPHGSIAKLIYGEASRGLAPSRRIRSSTEQRLFAVRPVLASRRDGQQVDATGTMRRLQGLVALDYPQVWLTGQLGFADPRHLWNILHGRAKGVTAATARRTCELYARLSMTPNRPDDHRGQVLAAIAHRTAARNGWPSPLAWDDDALDDSKRRPRGVRRAA